MSSASCRLDVIRHRAENRSSCSWRKKCSKVAASAELSVGEGSTCSNGIPIDGVNAVDASSVYKSVRLFHPGLRVCRAAWLFRVGVSEYREIVVGRPHAEPRHVPADLRAVRVAADVHGQNLDAPVTPRNATSYCSGRPRG